jgi:predicted deacetylase
MRDLLMPVLDALPARVDVFIRDDDAGWNDAQLLALLDVTGRCGVPIDLAAIPGAMSAGLARFLRARIAAAPGLVGVHQHGSTHLNHESEGRKCEFGVSRGAAAQRADLARGRAQLREYFGDLLQPIFTPPWNRCTEATTALLAELGFTALSRDRGARPAQHQLQEIAVDVDWSKHWRDGGASAVAAAFAQALRERAADGQPLGLMLHHAVMQQEEHAVLQELLGALAHHPRLRWRSMRELLVPMAPMNKTTACTTFA